MARLKILIVDDEPVFLEVMSMRINEWGYSLIKAENSKEAIEALKKNNPDIILLDYKLPDKDGIATLKEMRKINKRIPVIMFTAYPDTEAMKEADRLAVSAFIPKLSAYSDLKSSLRAAICMVEKKLNKK
jgi:DNA-binding NtrC family response regulator